MSNAAFVRCVAGMFRRGVPGLQEGRKNEITRNSARKSNLCSTGERKSTLRDRPVCFLLFVSRSARLSGDVARGNRIRVRAAFHAVNYARKVKEISIRNVTISSYLPSS